MLDSQEKKWWRPTYELRARITAFKKGLARAGGLLDRDDRVARLMGVPASSTLNTFLNGKVATVSTNVTTPDKTARNLIEALANEIPSAHIKEDSATDEECDYWLIQKNMREKISNELKKEMRIAKGLSPAGAEETGQTKQVYSNLIQESPKPKPPVTSRVRGLATLDAELKTGGNYGGDRVVLMVKPFFDRVGVDQPGYEDYEFALGTCRFELGINGGRVLNGLEGFARELGNLMVTARGPESEPYCEIKQKGQGRLLSQRNPDLERLCDLEVECTEIDIRLTFPRSALRLINPKDEVVSHNNKIDALVLDWLRRKHIDEIEEGSVHYVAGLIARRQSNDD